MADEAAGLCGVQSLISALATRLAASSPLDRDELISEAQIPALEAVRTHDPSKSALESWVYTKVWRHFAAGLRSQAWVRRLCRQEAGELGEVVDGTHHFDAEAFAAELSREAAFAVRLALRRGLRRVALVKALREEFRYELHVVESVFREVREGLGLTDV